MRRYIQFLILIGVIIASSNMAYYVMHENFDLNSIISWGFVLFIFAVCRAVIEGFEHDLLQSQSKQGLDFENDYYYEVILSSLNEIDEINMLGATIHGIYLVKESDLALFKKNLEEQMKDFDKTFRIDETLLQFCYGSTEHFRIDPVGFYEDGKLEDDTKKVTLIC